MSGKQGFLKYVKRAFVIPWNLLAFGAVSVAGMIAGYPVVVLPLAAAAEIAFVAGLAVNARFQSAIDAEELKARTGLEIESASHQIEDMLKAMSPKDRSRFEKLKKQCVDLREIARGIKGHTGDDLRILPDLQSGGMNRLLWIFLKLLYSKTSIERFFKTIDQKAIVEDIDRAEVRLAALGPEENDSETNRRRRATLQDHIRTSRSRLENYKNARDNYEFILDEIERLSSKIASLAELSINRQDPDFITREVDTVTASVQNSEQAMSELEFITGLSGKDDLTPALLDTHFDDEVTA
jgi:hypothetical protein